MPWGDYSLGQLVSGGCRAFFTCQHCVDWVGHFFLCYYTFFFVSRSFFIYEQLEGNVSFAIFVFIWPFIIPCISAMRIASYGRRERARIKAVQMDNVRGMKE